LSKLLKQPVRPASAVGPLDQVLRLLEEAFRKRRMRLSGNLTDRKLSLASKVLRQEDLAKSIAIVGRQLGRRFRDLKHRTGSYRELRVETGEYNRKAIAFAYAEAVADGDMDAAALTAALSAHIFDANHVVEQRMFSRFKDDFAKLGWDTPEAMEAVALTTAEHNRSIGRFLERFGLSADDLSGVDEVRSVTRVLQEKIKFAEELDYTPPADVFVVKQTTTLTELLDAYDRVYKTEFPDLHAKALAAKFAQWKKKLSG
jgi:hypothetical protein